MTDDPTLIAELSIRPEVLPLRMLCGCLLHTSDPFVQDSEGFVICPTHGARRYGWRSVPYVCDGMGAWSPEMYEQFVLFGQRPVLTTADEDYSDTVEDRRDNRDPTPIGSEILDKAAMKTTMNPSPFVQSSATYCDEATDSSHSSANGLNGI